MSESDCELKEPQKKKRKLNSDDDDWIPDNEDDNSDDEDIEKKNMYVCICLIYFGLIIYGNTKQRIK